MTQKQRSLATLGGVVVVAAGFGAYAWYGVYQKGVQEQAQKDKTDTLFDFPKDQVKQITVVAKGETTVASRNGNGWDLTAPIKTAGDSVAWGAIVDKLSGLKQKRSVEASKGLGPYGLQPPKVKIVVVLNSGQTQELDLGKDNSYDGTLFGKKGDQTQVAILDSSVKGPLEKNTFDLREKRLMIFEEADLKHIDVAVGKNAYGLDRQGDGKWKLTAPEQVMADSSKATQVSSALRNLRATRFVTDQATQEDLKRYGLDHPSATVEVILTKDSQPKTLTLSSVKEGDSEHVYAKRTEEPWIAEVGSQVLKDLDQTVDDLRDKTLLVFSPEEVRGLKFAIGQGQGSQTFEARREVSKADAGTNGENWTLLGPKPETAKKWKLSSLVTSLHDLKGSRIVEDNPTESDLTNHGLKPPEKMVTLLGAQGKVLAELSIGKSDKGKTYAQGNGSPRLFEVESYRLSQLPSSAADLAENPPAGSDAGTKVAATKKK